MLNLFNVNSSLYYDFLMLVFNFMAQEIDDIYNSC